MEESLRHHFAAHLYRAIFSVKKVKIWQVRVLNGEGGPQNVRDAFELRDCDAAKIADGKLERTRLADPGTYAPLAFLRMLPRLKESEARAT